MWMLICKSVQKLEPSFLKKKIRIAVNVISVSPPAVGIVEWLGGWVVGGRAGG
jgi:hypothetical protein